MTDQHALAAGAREIILELRESHRELVRFMDEVDRIAARQEIDGLELSSTRWKLSQSRRRNKALAHAMLEDLPAAPRAVHGGLIATMLSQSAKAMQETARHSGHWNLLAVTQDPLSYR